MAARYPHPYDEVLEPDGSVRQPGTYEELVTLAEQAAEAAPDGDEERKGATGRRGPGDGPGGQRPS